MTASATPARRLAELLKERQITQDELARRVKKSLRTVARWVKNGQGFDKDEDNQARVVRALGLAVDFFSDPDESEVRARVAQELLQMWRETSYGKLADEKTVEWLATFRFTDPSEQPTMRFYDIMFAAHQELVPFEQVVQILEHNRVINESVEAKKREQQTASTKVASAKKRQTRRQT